MKNEAAVVKENAQATFEDALARVVGQKKMSERRQGELMAKILMVKSNDASAIAAAEWDIAVSASEDGSSQISVDVVAHYIISNEDASDTMTVNYAAANSLIKNASKE